ncbi:hypothetical protein PYW07_008069 [Mythimna separata]|uniref:Uncharacterized protein n=1 Tax=Mythimna separata TaxID=271217 RepID=A0AAD7YQQ5_MYTSE|nr:hypothetical protein PYW07_008069 [Mythimna separata]
MCRSLSETPEMFRALALLCVAVAAVHGGPWEGGLNVRFELTVFGIGTTAFINLPLSVAATGGKGWKQRTRDNLPEGYSKLSIFCHPTDYTVCVFFDDTGYIAGLQVAINEADISDSLYDWSVQGFSRWTVDADGKILNLWTTQQYFITPETLATDPAIRVSQRNPNLMLQDHSIVVSGFNGELYRISTNVSDITGPNSDFTEQACIPWMGEHYYYKMKSSLECKADTLFPWFPLVYSHQLIGLGMVTFGKHTVRPGTIEWFEKPGRTAVQVIVPRGPQCLYDLADSPGLITMHTYYIKHPYEVTCVF